MFGPILAGAAFVWLAGRPAAESILTAGYRSVAIALGLEPLPPLGQPVWFWIARLAASFGEARAVALVSSVATALTVWVVYELLRTMPHDRAFEERLRDTRSAAAALASALAGAGLFLFSPFFASQQASPDPTAVNRLLWMLMFLLFGRCAARPSRWRIALFWLVVGLATAENPAVFWWVPVFLVGTWLAAFRHQRPPMEPLWAVPWFLLGALALITLPIAFLRSPLDQLGMFSSSGAVFRRTFGAAFRVWSAVLIQYPSAAIALIASILPGAYVLLRKPNRNSTRVVSWITALNALLTIGGVVILVDPARISPFNALVGRQTGWNTPYLFAVLWTAYLIGYWVVLLTSPLLGGRGGGTHRPLLGIPPGAAAAILIAAAVIPPAIARRARVRQPQWALQTVTWAGDVVRSCAGARLLIVTGGLPLYPPEFQTGPLPVPMVVPSSFLAPALRVLSHRHGQTLVVGDDSHLRQAWAQRWLLREAGALESAAGPEPQAERDQEEVLNLLLEQAARPPADAGGLTAIRFIAQPSAINVGQWRWVPMGLAEIPEDAERPWDAQAVLAANEQVRTELGPRAAASADAVAPLDAVSPQYSRWQNNLGIYARIRQLDGPAEDAVRRAIEINPASEIAIGNLVSLLLSQGRTNDVVQTLQQLQGVDSDTDTGLRTLARLQAAQDQWDAARATIDKRLARLPEDPLALRERARLALAQERPDEAVRVLEPLVERAPGDAEALRLLLEGVRAQREALGEDLSSPSPRETELTARIQKAMPDAERADAERLRLLFQRDGFAWSPNLLVLSGMAETARGDIRSALAQFEAAMEMAESEPPQLRQLVGRLKLLNRQPDLAIADFEQALATDAGNIDALKGLIEAGLLTDRAELVDRSLEQALVLAPEDPELLHYEGLRLLVANRIDEAQAALSASLQRRPGVSFTLFALALCHLQKQELAEAESLLQQAFTADPANESIFSTLVQLNRHMDKQSAIPGLARRRLQAVPGDRAAYLALLADDLARNDTVGLKKLIDEMRDNGVSTVPGYMALGMHHAEQGRRRDAIDAFLSVLDEAPDNVLALNNLAWYEAEEGHMDEALRRIDRCLALIPDQPNALDTRGWILLQMKRVEDARAEFARAAELAPQFAIFHLHHAQALAQLGRNAEAREALDRAIGLGLGPPDRSTAEALAASLP